MADLVQDEVRDLERRRQAEADARKKTAEGAYYEEYQDQVYGGWGKTQKESYSEEKGSGGGGGELPPKGPEEPKGPEGEGPESPVEKLKKEVEELRAAYVKEDYETMSTWTKLKNIFGGNIKEDEKKREYQEQYQNALLRLQEAQLVELKQKGLAGQELKSGMAELLRYTKLDEAVNLINDRTQYRAENRSWPTKVADIFGSLGRSYNRLSFKEKMLLTGLLTTGAVVSTVSGGFVAGALAGMFMAAKRVTGGAATFAGTEALLEKIGDKRRVSKATEEIGDQLGSERRMDFDKLEAMIRQDVMLLDGKLQAEKRAKFFRKGAAALAGVAVANASWLLNNTVAEDAIREHMNGMSGAVAAAPDLADQDLPRELVDSNNAAKMKAAAEYLVASPEEQAQIREVTGMTDEKLRELASSGAKNVSEKFQDILSGPYEVQKGDSVWKILGARAEGLEGAQKTHFIDALKDKVGDVQLKAGEEFDFSKYLKPEDIRKAYADAQGLSADKVASIAANDLKISEYVQSHPGTHLTHETVDKILQGKMDAAATDLSAQAAAEAKVPLESFGPTETVSSGISAPSPETIAQFKGRADDWFMQMFRVENANAGQDWIFDRDKIGATKLRDMVSDADLYRRGEFSGYRTGLSQEQMKNFAEFSGGIWKVIGRENVVEMMKAKPDMTVTEYLQRVAPLVKQGQRIGLYTTTY